MKLVKWRTIPKLARKLLAILGLMSSVAFQIFLAQTRQKNKPNKNPCVTCVYSEERHPESARGRLFADSRYQAMVKLGLFYWGKNRAMLLLLLSIFVPEWNPNRWVVFSRLLTWSTRPLTTHSSLISVTHDLYPWKPNFLLLSTWSSLAPPHVKIPEIWTCWSVEVLKYM